MSKNEKIYRVHAHDTVYGCRSPQYFIAPNEELLRDELGTDYGDTLVIDAIVEVAIEEVVNQLNLYID